jgi:hypothetical protein
MRIAIVIMLSLILQDVPRLSQTENERDPEDVKYEHELWKRLQGRHWRAENDPSRWPKFMRARGVVSDPTRKDLWQVESVYTIRDIDSCRRLATEAVSTYGGALQEVQLTIGESICYFFVKTDSSFAELMSRDKRIRRVREVDDNFPPTGRSMRSLLRLQR